ncbi:uncharacterized protein LOC131622500 [Vicia villosa]|uniref:uncharacterized protein LOC131622500 n=1 Tax=Vicia villosa TaxID=3911 RepID=UPI00273C5387|nr:uncharacterized protein LOC131622500 [Vicia villosa]
MWVKKGIINIIDLSNDYYLVTFSHDQDHMNAIMNGPWFIYDHYLTVKAWSPDFHPKCDTIKSVAVWVRIAELPIEYYDSRVLHHIGDNIGKTIKVDKNTGMHERGKYARICVEVDLTKPLVAMFMIKERKYNVEYEGLHLLCTLCGRFGHYAEGCPEKVKEVERNRVAEVGLMENADRVEVGLIGEKTKGSWMIVQKHRRIKRGKEKELNVAGGGERKNPPSSGGRQPNNNGSRFAALSQDQVDAPDKVMDTDVEDRDNNLQYMHGNDMEVSGSKSGTNNNHVAIMEDIEKGEDVQTVGNNTNEALSESLRSLEVHGGGNYDSNGSVSVHVIRGKKKDKKKQ